MIFCIFLLVTEIVDNKFAHADRQNRHRHLHAEDDVTAVKVDRQKYGEEYDCAGVRARQRTYCMVLSNVCEAPIVQCAVMPSIVMGVSYTVYNV